ncbi:MULTISPECIES: hypothetical protein [Bacillus]|uniref:hypothetical protein n=1 Tax=Bacillus TaxID=1386 RepID=UPI001571D72C|nr:MULTISPECIES: hypothetical protein [Bacillus]MBC6975090.1 hypothetical protein [Bacillus sp. Xin]MBY0600400.1 hypothetical protein [Bacillus bingmayongensis]NSW38419.1 hypothetical protein [Bacillus sp. Xin1]
MIQLTVKGQPSHIRHLAHDPEYLFAIEFHDVTKQMTSINKEEQSVKVTALIRSEQWNQLLQMIAEAGDSLADANEIIMEGTMGHTPEEVYTFAPVHIKYRSHLQQKQEEKEAEIREEKTTRIASKTKSTVFKRIEQLHAKYDGVCQRCGQRCDKRVVSIKKIQSKMGIVCPDCKNGTTFLIREVKGELQQELLQNNLFSTEQEMLSYFQEFCSQFALVTHQETYRMYWSWDKKQVCREVHISNEGTIYKVRLNDGGRCIPTKFPLQITIKENVFQVYHPSTEMRMDRIRALLDTQKASIKEEEIIKQIQYYETKKTFSEKIIVKRADNSKRYQVLSGYAAYEAAKKLKLRHIYVTVVVDVRKEVVQNT